MFCPECGTRNEDGAKFCEACGTSLMEYQTSPEPQFSSMPQPASAPEMQFGSMPQQAPPEPQYQQTSPESQVSQPASGPGPQFGSTPQQAPPEPQYQQVAPPPQPQYQQATAAQPQYQQATAAQPQYQQTPPVQPQYQFGPQPQYQQAVPPQQPRPQQPRPKQPRTPKKKISIAALLAVIFESVLALGLVIGIFFVLNSKFSPESVALNYWKAVTAHQWGEAYDYCEFPDSEFLTKQMYVNVNSARDEEPILQYKSVRAEKEGDWGEQFLGLDSDSDSSTYVITYMIKGSSYEETEYLTLSKTGRKQFLFWDEWKVTSSDSWCQNVSFEIPKGAVMRLNGMEVPEDAAVEDEYARYVTIPYLFAGSYQMEVEAEGMEPYRTVTYVDSYGVQNNYVELRPSQETIEAVAGQAAEDLKKIMDSALAGEGFDAVADCFTEEAKNGGDVMEEYEELYRITGDGVEEGIVTLTMDSMVTTLDAYPSQTTMYFKLQAHVKETYLQFWTEELGEYEDTENFYFTYVKEGDAWKLAEMPVSRYDFYY